MDLGGYNSVHDRGKEGGRGGQRKAGMRVQVNGLTNGDVDGSQETTVPGG